MKHRTIRLMPGDCLTLAVVGAPSHKNFRFYAKDDGTLNANSETVLTSLQHGLDKSGGVLLSVQDEHFVEAVEILRAS